MNRIILFFIGFFLVGSAIYWVGFTQDQPYEGTYNQVQELIQKKDSVFYLTMGNSHAASVDFSAMGLKGGYDLSAGFMDVFELYHLAHYLIPELPKLKQVYIPISYYFFQFDNAGFEDEYQLSFRKRTYFMTPQISLIDEDPLNLFQAKMSPITRPDHWRGVWVNLLKGNLSKIAVLRPSKEPEPSNDFLLKHAKGRVKQNKKQAQEMLKSRPELLNDSQIKFEQLLEFFKSRKVQPFFYTPSYHQFYTERFDSTIKNNSLEIIQQLKKEHQLIYFDFSNDSDLASNNAIYRDSDHYNPAGRIVFSKQLRDSLIQYQFIEQTN